MYSRLLLVVTFATGLVLGKDKPQSHKSPPRIVGGYVVEPAFKYSWMVQIKLGGRHQCGGTLYNDDTVITAAHCSIFPKENYTVSVHRHNITLPDKDENGHTYKVKKITNHSDYNSKTIENDISIWKLDRPYPSKEPKVELDVDNLSAKTGTLLKVIGWGRTAHLGIASSVLLEVKVPVYNITKCIKDYNNSGEIVYPKTQFCAAYPEGGKDACQGDSGGPLFVESHGRAILLGIVSWGVGCASPGNPGVYTKVHTYTDWIKQNI